MDVRRFVCLFLIVTLGAAGAAAQSLGELQRRFAGEMRALQTGDSTPSREQVQKLLQQQATTLAAFIKEQKGIDRCNGILMLTDLRVGAGDQAGAVEALQQMDANEAPALVLLTAAEMASRLGQKELRGKWIDAALAKEAPFEQRMAMGRVLMTLLREPERGEKLFAEALAAQKDDEGRANVRWHHADAVREREDVAENAYFDELEKLSKELPATYFGGVAKDRLLASKFQVGSAAIPFTAKTVDGAELKLADWQGRVVVLAFFAVAEPQAPALVNQLKQIAAGGGQSVQLLGIAVDRNAAAATAAHKQLGIDFPMVIEGKGWQADLALRYFVETAPTVIVIGRDGKIAGLNLHGSTKDSADELKAVVEQARKIE
jgi:peroxiredoxin